MINEKVRFPWRSISAILAVFGVLIIAYHLWIPLKLKYFYWRLYSDNNKICVAAVDGLKDMGKKGRQVLVTACGSEDAVEFLLENWDNVIFPNDYVEMPLHIAVTRGYAMVARLLIAKGAHIDSHDRGGWTPLHIAAAKGHADVVKLLVSKNADVNAKGRYHITPLHVAAVRGNTAVLKLLLARGANINAVKKSGETALHLAVLRNQKEIAIKLIESGAEVNAKDNCKWTPLHSAVMNGLDDIIELLLSKGATLNAISKAGNTPLDVTRVESTIKLLRARGGKSGKELGR